MIKITKCQDCPFRRISSDGKVRLTVCDHPEAPTGYDSVIDRNDDRGKFPNWCPLIDKHFILMIDLKHNPKN